MSHQVRLPKRARRADVGQASRERGEPSSCPGYTGNYALNSGPIARRREQSRGARYFIAYPDRLISPFRGSIAKSAHEGYRGLRHWSPHAAWGRGSNFLRDVCHSRKTTFENRRSRQEAGKPSAAPSPAVGELSLFVSFVFDGSDRLGNRDTRLRGESKY